MTREQAFEKLQPHLLTSAYDEVIVLLHQVWVNGYLTGVAEQVEISQKQRLKLATGSAGDGNFSPYDDLTHEKS